MQASVCCAWNARIMMSFFRVLYERCSHSCVGICFLCVHGCVCFKYYVKDLLIFLYVHLLFGCVHGCVCFKCYVKDLVIFLCVFVCVDMHYLLQSGLFALLFAHAYVQYAHIHSHKYKHAHILAIYIYIYTYSYALSK
jgi:hypothetical protein